MTLAVAPTVDRRASRSRGRPLDLILLATILLLAVWWRAHTFAPDVAERLGLVLWPVIHGESEPLDCDEAAYGYIGRRLVEGAVMYRDVTENKPPLGYWIYALGVRLGGARELTIRLLALPFVLGTLALVYSMAMRLSGRLAAVLSALFYVLMSTDPFVYGNGTQFGQFINFFALSALAFVIFASGGKGLWEKYAWFLAGASVGAASLVRQVSALHLLSFGLLIMVCRDDRSGGTPGRGRQVLQFGGLLAGFVVTWAIAAAFLVLQGALPAAIDDVIRYGGALATDTPTDPRAPSFLVRWVTGNADPSGELPWPFGRSTYLVWWGRGCWPLWLLGLAGVVSMLPRGQCRTRRATSFWTISALMQVALPRLFWPHYYLAPTPGLALAGGVLLADCIWTVWRPGLPIRLRAAAALCAVLSVLAATATLVFQVRGYLLVAPERITAECKGGKQWVTLRAMGRDLARRSRDWEDPHLLVWGWQSPLLFYSGLDSVTPHFFVDPLLKAYSGREHPLIKPRLERIMRDFDAHRPDLVFAGDPPFPELRERLGAGYLPSRLTPWMPDGRGLWVEQGRYSDFERRRPGTELRPTTVSGPADPPA